MSLKITLELMCLRVLAYRDSHNPWPVKGQEGSEATTCHSAPSPALATRYQWGTDLLAQGLPRHLLGVGRDLSTIWLLVGVRA